MSKAKASKIRTVADALSVYYRSHAEAVGRLRVELGQGPPRVAVPAAPKIDPSVYRVLWAAGVSGIGFGIKESEGNLIPIPAARVYVGCKKPMSSLERSLRVPAQIPGSEAVGPPLDTDVVAAGALRPLPDSDPGTRGDSDRGTRSGSDWLAKDLALLRGPIRPLHAGCSVGPPLELAGTLGCFVCKRGADDVYLLSNNHVLAGGRLRIHSRGAARDESPVPDGAPISQPGRIDSSEPYILDQLKHGAAENQPVAELSAAPPILTRDPGVAGAPLENRVDAAIALVDTPTAPSQSPIYTLPGFGLMPPPSPYDRTQLLYRAVGKVGRTTGSTIGIVVDVDARFWIPYGAPNDYDRYGLFVAQLVVLPVGRAPDFSAAGDSGSAVFDLRSRQLVGLLFAGSDAGYTIVNPIDAVFDALHLELA